MEQNEIQVELAVQKEPARETKGKLDISKFILPGSILIAALLISGSLVFYSLTTKGNLGAVVGGDNNGNTIVEVSIDDDPMLGNPKAKVTLVEFSDFQCPFCRSFWAGAYQQIKTEYIDTGKIRFVYRDFPLSFHPGAAPAAQGAECADDQGKFWEMHDKIFEEQAKQGGGTIQFSENEVKKWAGLVAGLDMAKWNECFNSGKYK
ncbi:MAG: thioredoxin domain-containing protein, partial [Candidatus Paceibacterota bacterium]